MAQPFSIWKSVTALQGSVNQAAYKLLQNLGGGVETRPLGIEFWPEVGGRQGEVGGSTPKPPGNSNTALENGIVTFYENFTNKYGIIDKLGGGIHPLVHRVSYLYMYLFNGEFYQNNLYV